MIIMSDYWMGRDKMYPTYFSTEVEANGERMVALANLLLTRFGEFRKVTSGWRPPLVNRSTPGAALNSNHMSARAIDLADPDGDLDEWLMTEPGQRALDEIGLWMEHPAATKGWAHLQSVPQRSYQFTGNRVFYP